jgi:hypothetical protein
MSPKCWGYSENSGPCWKNVGGEVVVQSRTHLLGQLSTSHSPFVVPSLFYECTKQLMSLQYQLSCKGLGDMFECMSDVCM